MAVKVSIHIKENDSTNHWSGHRQAELTRVPMVGEHISFGLDQSPAYKVTFVNHYAFNNDVDAEVFVQPADFDEVKRAAGWTS